MGLVLPQTIKVRISGKTRQHYREKGFKFEKPGDWIDINVLDLPEGSAAKVKIICDICGKESEMWYRTVVEHNKKK